LWYWWSFLEDHDLQWMKNRDHEGGFSVDGSVQVHKNDREGLERLLRYCARPAFSLEKLEKVSEIKLSYQLKEIRKQLVRSGYSTVKAPMIEVKPSICRVDQDRKC